VSDPSEQYFVAAVLSSLHERISKLEKDGDKSLLTKITTNASAVALFLGLVLTLASLYEVFVAKPKGDRIAALSKFNQAVNSAAKTRQEVTRQQLAKTDPATQLAIASAATPQILNDISTARAMLRDLEPEDIGIPQLLILIYESFTAGDLPSAKDFVTRAVDKKDVSPALRSEALRYDGRYQFAARDLPAGRQAFESSLAALPDPVYAAQRAYILMDWTVMEYTLGDCAAVQPAIDRLEATLHSPGIALEARAQIEAGLKQQLVSMQGQHCALPAAYAASGG
jgi:hypothetical protein